MIKLKVNLKKNMIGKNPNPFFQTKNFYFNFITTFIAYGIVAGFFLLVLILVWFAADTGLNMIYLNQSH